MFTPRIRLRCTSRPRSNLFHATGLQSNDVSSTTTTSMSTATTAGGEKGRTLLSAAARSMCKKRALMKEDKDAWILYKAAEAERQRKRRKNRSHKQKKRDKETGKKRSREYYLKMKETGSLPKTQKEQKKRLTRAEQKNARDYNRERQREWRTNQTEQKKAWIRKKNRVSKKAKRDAVKLKKRGIGVTSTPNPTQTGYKTEGAKRTAFSRLWGSIPKDPEKFATLVSRLVTTNRLTPRKKHALKSCGFSLQDTATRRKLFDSERVWKQINTTVNHLKSDHTDKGRERRFAIVSAMLVKKKYRALSRELGVRPNYVCNVGRRSAMDVIGEMKRFRKKRTDGTCIDVISSIEDIYRSAKVSTALPLPVKTSDLKPKFTMNVSIARAHKMWKEDYPSHNVSLNTFRKLRPPDVNLLRRHRLNQCLCEICTDILLKLRVLNRQASIHNMKDLISIEDKYQLVSLTMCPPPNPESRYASLKCINRNCDDCGVNLLQSRLEPFLVHGSKQISWEKWENVDYVHDGKTKTKKLIVRKNGTVREFTEELIKATIPLSSHIFVANWQGEMFSKISKVVPEDAVVMVLDFAENFSCFYQDEIQDAHWSKNQVTLHPIVAYYRCPDHDGDHIIAEAITFISSDLKHDGHAVQHFVNMSLEYLRTKRHLTITKLIEFSDGCGVQYKSKLPFCDISFSEEDFGLRRERNFFGSRHGKGPSDGVSGVVKTAVRLAVISREATVDTAESMYDFCSKNLTKTDCRKQRRVFLYVGDGEVNRERPQRNVKTALKGTRLLHAVRSEEPGVVGVRLLSCFCDGCLTGNGETCMNTDYVQPWQKRAIQLTNPPPPPTEQDMIPASVLDGADQHHASRELQDIWKSFTQGVPSDGPADMADSDAGNSEIGLLNLLEEITPPKIDITPDSSSSKNYSPTVPPCTALQLDTGALQEINIIPGQFYGVYFTRKFYVGKVVGESTTSSGSFIVDFLERRGANVFVWPVKQDKDDKIERNRIFFGPLTFTGHHSLCLDAKDIKEMQKRQNILKKIYC